MSSTTNQTLDSEGHSLNSSSYYSPSPANIPSSQQSPSFAGRGGGHVPGPYAPPNSNYGIVAQPNEFSPNTVNQQWAEVSPTLEQQNQHYRSHSATSSVARFQGSSISLGKVPFNSSHISPIPGINIVERKGFSVSSGDDDTPLQKYAKRQGTWTRRITFWLSRVLYMVAVIFLIWTGRRWMQANPALRMDDFLTDEEGLAIPRTLAVGHKVIQDENQRVQVPIDVYQQSGSPLVLSPPPKVLPDSSMPPPAAARPVQPVNPPGPPRVVASNKLNELPITYKNPKDLFKHSERQEAVIIAFRHAWRGYRKYAFGYDEFHPISMVGSNWFTLGLTILDSMGTALLMNQLDIYEECLDWVRNSMSFDVPGEESNVFEITIRVLGSLISVYTSTKEEILLKRAVELADILLLAFDTPTGIPMSSINFRGKRGVYASGGASTAEATSIQLEFKYLSYLTGDPKYWNAAQPAMKAAFQNNYDGLVPIYMDPSSGIFFSSEIRLGSRGDSYYEYIAKQYLLSSTRVEGPKMEAEYRKAVRGIRRHLLGISYPHGYLWPGELPGGLGSALSSKMDHLVCFLPGTLALFATKGHRVTPQLIQQNMTLEDSRDLELAKEFMSSCIAMYFQSQARLAPEIVFWNTPPAVGDTVAVSESPPPVRRAIRDFHAVVDADVPGALVNLTTAFPEASDRRPLDPRAHYSDTPSDFSIHALDGHNLLRPETVESLFMLYAITGDESYSDMGWEIFGAFEKWAKVPNGYSNMADIRFIPPIHRDKMETFFMGETLKYFFLLFDPEPYGKGGGSSGPPTTPWNGKHRVPLTRGVFNTEAHFLPSFDIQERFPNMSVLTFL